MTVCKMTNLPYCFEYELSARGESSLGRMRVVRQRGHSQRASLAFSVNCELRGVKFGKIRTVTRGAEGHDYTDISKAGCKEFEYRGGSPVASLVVGE